MREKPSTEVREEFGTLNGASGATLATSRPDLWPKYISFGPMRDEPEAGIDLWSFSNLIAVFEKLYEEINGSIMIITHQERILEIADRIIVIANGAISEDGQREEMLPKLISGGQCAKLSAV